MRTSHDIEAGLNDEIVAARVLHDMGYVPRKARPGTRIVKRPGCDDSAVMLPPALSEPERLDREMEQRGGLLRAIEPEPGSVRMATPEEMELIRGGQGRTGAEVMLTGFITGALIAIGIVAAVLAIAWTTGGGQ